VSTALAEAGSPRPAEYEERITTAYGSDLLPLTVDPPAPRVLQIGLLDHSSAFDSDPR